MLEHQKIVIKNVAYNKDLFEKEIYKSLKWLSNNEQQQLYSWLIEQFGKTNREIIENIFNMQQAV